MTEDYTKLVQSIDELKIKIPSLLDLIDEVIEHETRFRAIDEKSTIAIAQLKKLRTTLENLPLDNKKLNDLVKDDNNISVAILLFEKILDRKDKEIKEYLKECILDDDVSNFVGKALLDNKKKIAEFVWKSLEEKLHLFIGKRVLAGTVGAGVILGVIYMIASYVQSHI